MTWEPLGFTLRYMDADELSLADRFAIGVVKVVLLTCSIYAGAAMPDGPRYLAIVGLLTYALLRYLFPSRGLTAPR